jgi:hypothetical protein
MKAFSGTISLILLYILVSAHGFSQNPIPNPSFENWTNGEPDGWTTSNDSLINVKQSNDAYDGNSSALITSCCKVPLDSYLKIQFNYTERPSSLKGYFKRFGNPLDPFADALIMLIFMYDEYGYLVASGQYAPLLASEWTQFDIIITDWYPQVPIESCFIFIEFAHYSDSLNGYALIDDLQFDGTIDIKTLDNNLATHYELKQNYPNPFNPTTNIEFSLPKSEFVTLKVYSILGEEVATLVSEKLTAGSYKYDWDASGLASGVYLYRIQAGNNVKVRKMILMK